LFLPEGMQKFLLERAMTAESEGQNSPMPDPENARHIPVLFEEVKLLLPVSPGDWVIDATLGGGGHTRIFLEQGARVLGLDADPAAIRRVSESLGEYIASDALVVVQSPFEAIAEVAAEVGIGEATVILADLGISSFQLETAARGFSFQQDGALDMRFDPHQGISAGEIINQWHEQEIADLIYEFGEERKSRAIARAIVRNRPIESTTQLAEVVERAVGGRRGSRIHPATQTFQALRIAVNRELAQLQALLPQAETLLKRSGRMGIIAFHSLEDRIVKQWMAEQASDFTPDPHHPFGGVERTPTLKLVTRKPVVASDAEIIINPRSRSARLRVAEKH
jgi:16S rRNA (cytosine1402-N4)-methyltransferase